jgi:hypothetical protein
MANQRSLTTQERHLLADLQDCGEVAADSEFDQDEDVRTLHQLAERGLIRRVEAWQLTGAGRAALTRPGASLIGSRPDLDPSTAG